MKQGNISVIKYLDLDADFCIPVFETGNWYSALAAMKHFEETRPHGNGIYFFDSTDKPYHLDA